ncbi:hypothetical protein M0R45_015892 [Rubus argutus]|uniref:Vomeronasal type-1 receptor n=1 Tax=Rubus argutus TaxID=59490 RepID=A0AAW1XS39_RUBAR
MASTITTAVGVVFSQPSRTYSLIAREALPQHVVVLFVHHAAMLTHGAQLVVCSASCYHALLLYRARRCKLRREAQLRRLGRASVDHTVTSTICCAIMFLPRLITKPPSHCRCSLNSRAFSSIVPSRWHSTQARRRATVRLLHREALSSPAAILKSLCITDATAIHHL